MHFSSVLKTILILVVHSGILRTYSTKYECPKVPRGCICEENEENELPNVECRRTNYEELQKFIYPNNQLKFEKFGIATSKLDEVNRTMFSTASMKELEFRSVEVEIFHLFKALTSLWDLRKLVLENVAVEKWVFTSAKDSKIEKFTLLDCPGPNDIEMINYLPKNVVIIAVRWCRLRSGKRTFKRFENLVVLDLRHNLLTRVYSDLFPLHADQLRTLQLSHNPIKSIAYGSFSAMTKLNALDIEYANIATVSHSAFKPILPNLNFLQFANNPWDCNCFTSWITTVVLKVNMEFPICHSPENLRGKPLNIVTPKEMCQQEGYQKTLHEYCLVE